MVGHEIECRMGRADLDVAEQLLPVIACSSEDRLCFAVVRVAPDQLERLSFVLPRAEDERHAGLCAGFELEFELERSAWIEIGTRAVREFACRERLRSCARAVATEEFVSIARGRTNFGGRGQEHPRPRERGHRVSREDGAQVRAIVGDGRGAERVAMTTECPLDVAVETQPSRSVRAILQRDVPNFDGIERVDGHAEALHEVLARVLEAGVALAMSHVVGGGPSSGGRREAPAFALVQVAEIKELTGWVERWIVGPRREAILLAVLEPGEARPAFGDQRAKPRIGHHVAPRLWRCLCWPDPHHVVAAREIEATEPVVKRQCTARDGARACWTGLRSRIRQTLAEWGRRALRGLLQGPVRQRPGPSCRERTKLPG